MNQGFVSRMLLAVALGAGAAVADEGAVVRAVYTSGVQDRQPVDEITAAPKQAQRIYFFTELRNLAGQTVTHRWQHGSQSVFEVPFEVKAARWRVWSSKEIQPGVSGEWSVVVVDSKGEELSRTPLPQGQ